MADQRFFERHGPFTLQELAACSGAELPEGYNADTTYDDVAAIDKAEAGQVSFLDNKKYLEAFKTTSAGACFVHPDMAELAPEGTICLTARNPYKAYALAAQKFYPEKVPSQNDHAPTAVIHETAEIGDNCLIEANVVIGANVKIGQSCIIKACAVIDDSVEIGNACIIGANATLSHCILGERVSIYPGVRIGQRGFGFAIDPAGFVSVPQLGRVIIEDDVEIGANTTIDRGAGPDTVIGAGTRLDNLVQIGHNVKIGKNCVMVAQSGVAGSTEIGDFVMIGGQAGVAGHIEIGSGVRIAGQSGVMKSIPAGQQDYMGSPAVPLKQFMKQTATLGRMVRGKKKKKS